MGVDHQRRWLDRLVYLDDHWTVDSVPGPTMALDPLEYQRRVGQVVAALVDFPLSMIMEQHAQHTGNFSAQITFARDRMKALIVDMNAFLEDVILEAEKDNLKRLFRKASESEVRHHNRSLTEEELMAIHRDVHSIQVEQQCTPLLTIDQITHMFEYGSYSQRTMALRFAHLTGIPEEDIEIFPIKRTRELEYMKLQLAERQQRQQERQMKEQLAQQRMQMANQSSPGKEGSTKQQQQHQKKAGPDHDSSPNREHQDEDAGADQDRSDDPKKKTKGRGHATKTKRGDERDDDDGEGNTDRKKRAKKRAK